jgi:hypothetical protein
MHLRLKNTRNPLPLYFRRLSTTRTHTILAGVSARKKQVNNLKPVFGASLAVKKGTMQLRKTNQAIPSMFSHISITFLEVFPNFCAR